MSKRSFIAVVVQVMLIGAHGACGSSSTPRQSPSPAPPTSESELPPCREAVHDESRLLVKALGENDAPKGLAIQLDELAASLEIDWEVLESLGQLRTTAHQRVSPSRLPELEKAAEVVGRACAGLDVAEERAKKALDAALRLLANGEYREFITEFVPPADVARMRKDGDLDPAVRRFESGFGQRLRRQLEQVRNSAPTLKPDGSVEFRAEGQDGASAVVVLEKIGGRWFFRQ
ncbi:MAG: hypothetical protein KJO07_24410 [Deltaproteobacteria bacterium]|nr:hypothetical protein [Deltaproteobacteria bacterium]